MPAARTRLSKPIRSIFAPLRLLVDAARFIFTSRAYNLHMRIQLESINFDLTPTIRAHVEEKIGSLARMMERFEKDGDVLVAVEVSKPSRHHKQGDVFFASATFSILGKTFRMEQYDADLHVAIDRIKDRIKDDIRDFKEKTIERSRGR